MSTPPHTHQLPLTQLYHLPKPITQHLIMSAFNNTSSTTKPTVGERVDGVIHGVGSFPHTFLHALSLTSPSSTFPWKAKHGHNASTNTHTTSGLNSSHTGTHVPGTGSHHAATGGAYDTTGSGLTHGHVTTGTHGSSGLTGSHGLNSGNHTSGGLTGSHNLNNTSGLTDSHGQNQCVAFFASNFLISLETDGGLLLSSAGAAPALGSTTGTGAGLGHSSHPHSTTTHGFVPPFYTFALVF